MNVLGMMMIAAPFIALYIYAIRTIGWRGANITYVITILLATWIIIGIYLLGIE